jgi:hypothetical protein
MPTHKNYVMHPIAHAAVAANVQRREVGLAQTLNPPRSLAAAAGFVGELRWEWWVAGRETPVAPISGSSATMSDYESTQPVNHGNCAVVAM